MDVLALIGFHFLALLGPGASAIWRLVAQVTMTPDPNALPGGPQAQQVINGLGFYGFLSAVGALVLACMVWAFGSHSQNYRQVEAGKRGVLVSSAVAFVIGAAAALVTFFGNLGGAVQG
jgi:hypothetical protein